MDPISFSIPLAVAIVVGGWIFSLFLRNKDSKAEQSKESKAELESLKQRIAELEFPVKLMWATKQKEYSDTLHHPHIKDHEMDDLLEKLNKIKITPDETLRLKALLLLRSEDMSDEISPEERKIAGQMAGVMDETLLEQVRNLQAMKDHHEGTDIVPKT